MVWHNSMIKCFAYSLTWLPWQPMQYHWWQKSKIWVFSGVLISNYRSFSRLMLIYLTILRIKQLWYDMIQQLKPFRIHKPGCHDNKYNTTGDKNWLFSGVLRPDYRNFSRLMLIYHTIKRSMVWHKPTLKGFANS